MISFTCRKNYQTMSKEALGNFVKEKRKKLGLTQDELAEGTERDQAYVYRLETGKQTGSVDTLIKVANALQVRPGVLVDILAGVTEEGSALHTLILPDNFDQRDIADVEKYIQLINAKKALDANAGYMEPTTTEEIRERLRQSNVVPGLEPAKPSKKRTKAG